MNVHFAKKQPIIWRNLLEQGMSIDINSRSRKRRSAKPARVPGCGVGTFEIMPDFFRMPDDFMEFFGGPEEDSVARHFGSSSA